MWHHIWHLQTGVDEKVVRTVLVYVFLVVAFRVFGKRELGQSTTLDLAVLLLVANAVQNGIIGDDVSVTGALVGAGVLFGLNRALAIATSRWDWLSRAVEGTPTTLIEHGHPVRQNLRHEQISLPELRAIARRQGFPELGAVHTAILETNGTVSMFREDEPGTYHPDESSGLRIGKRRRGPWR